MENNKPNIIDHTEKEAWVLQSDSKGYCDKDIWNISAWFIKTMSYMLEEMIEHLKGYPDEYNNVPVHENRKASALNGNELPGQDEWQRTLKRMLFLLNEMDPDKCSYKNPVQEELDEVKDNLEEAGYDYLAKYIEQSDDPQLQLLYQKHRYQELQVWHYRDRCREEFFNLYSKWFWHLWN